MRVSILVVAAASFAVQSTVFAAKTQFPYEAVVQKDGEIVRSGPGEQRYEATMKLSSGQRVTVHRHDPGGWFMIAPPPGSFSWINASYVEKAGDGRYLVKAPPLVNGLPPRVVVYIGSQFSNEHKVYGRQLASGDEITVIGEEISQTGDGPVKFYKIEPPRLEYRWIKGDYVLPLSEIAESPPSNPVKPIPFDAAAAAANDPFAGPAFASQPAPARPGFPVERETKLLERELDRAVDTNAVAKSGPDVAELNQARDQLAALDEQLKAMLAQGPGQWRLEEMAQSYRSFQATATPGIAGMVDARLDALEARKQIKAEYDAFVAITSRTDQRDAELVSLQSPNMIGIPVASNGVQLGLPQPVDPQQPISTVPTNPLAGGMPADLSSANPGAAPAGPASDVDVNQLDGAGIVSRLPVPRPGFPQHILVAPDGRLLAYLQAEGGVNLDAHLGQSVGVVGRRSQEAQLRSDLIIVRQVTPVRLQP